MCAQLIGRIREHLGQEVPLVRLFEHPTIAQLAKHLETLQPSAAGVAPLPDTSLDAVKARAARQRAGFTRPPGRKP
jgi:Phosphopantetheine attachment site